MCPFITSGPRKCVHRRLDAGGHRASRTLTWGWRHDKESTRNFFSVLKLAPGAQAYPNLV